MAGVLAAVLVAVPVAVLAMIPVVVPAAVLAAVPIFGFDVFPKSFAHYLSAKSCLKQIYVFFTWLTWRFCIAISSIVPDIWTVDTTHTLSEYTRHTIRS